MGSTVSYDGMSAAALRQGQLELHYQPVVSQSSGRIVGAEALLRWVHPDAGILGPAEILADAERNGTMEQLGRWIIDTAIAEQARWPGHLFVTINTAPSQLVSDDLADIVGDACRRHGVRPEDVYIEVTEHEMADLDAVRRTLDALVSLGVRIALDDFGAGHTSFARLRELPFQMCKLDRSLTIDTAGSDVIRAIVDLAHALGMSVVAEGIETGDQCARMAGLGCDLAQGFVLVKPLPAEQLRQLLAVDDARYLPTTARPEHRLVLHLDEQVLVHDVATELASALADDEVVVLIVTDTRRRALSAAMSAAGVDVAAAVRDGRLCAVDVDALIGSLLVDGRVDPFHLVDRLASTFQAGTDGRPIRVHSELGGQLWERGHVTAALDLEERCGDLGRDRDVQVTCTYALSTVGGTADVTAFERLCREHDRVVPAEPAPELRSRQARELSIARMQRDAVALAAWRELAKVTVHEVRNANTIASLALAMLETQLGDIGDRLPIDTSLLTLAQDAISRVGGASDVLALGPAGTVSSVTSRPDEAATQPELTAVPAGLLIA